MYTKINFKDFVSKNNNLFNKAERNYRMEMRKYVYKRNS